MLRANTAPCSAAVHAPEGLPDRDDVVVDGLGQPDDGQLVVVAGQVGREVGGRGVGVVAADGVQHVDAVGGQLVGRDLERVLALGDQPALDEVRRVGQLDPAVAERAAAEAVQQVRVPADLVGHRDRAAGEQAGVAVEVADDLHVGGDLGVPLDQAADRGRQAGREPPGRQHGHLADSRALGHASPLLVLSRAATPYCATTAPAAPRSAGGRGGRRAGAPRGGDGGGGRQPRRPLDPGDRMTESTDVRSSSTTNIADFGREMWSFLTGKGAVIDYTFVDMTVEVPRETGPQSPAGDVEDRRHGAHHHHGPRRGRRGLLVSPAPAAVATARGGRALPARQPRPAPRRRRPRRPRGAGRRARRRRHASGSSCDGPRTCRSSAPRCPAALGGVAGQVARLARRGELPLPPWDQPVELVVGTAVVLRRRGGRWAPGPRAVAPVAAAAAGVLVVAGLVVAVAAAGAGTPAGPAGRPGSPSPPGRRAGPPA